MIVNIAGSLQVQAIPNANLSPYVKLQIQMQNRWCNEDAIKLLAALCDGPTPFRRIWNKAEYERFKTEQLENLTLESLEKFAQKDSRILEALHGSGLLAALTGALGGYGPRVVGGMGSGNVAAGTFGYGAASPVFGSAGQFGYGMAAGGQFGASGRFRARDYCSDM